MMDSVLVLHLIIGPLLLFVFSLAKIFPPKKINLWYGYRTKRSMKNQEAWKIANEYSADLMLKLGIAIPIFQAMAYLLIGGPTSIIFTCAFVTIGPLMIIVLTERHLKRLGW